MSEAIIYRDSAGEWRFRVTADNGEILLASEGYATKHNAERGLEDALEAFIDADVTTTNTEEGGEAA